METVVGETEHGSTYFETEDCAGEDCVDCADLDRRERLLLMQERVRKDKEKEKWSWI